uniref:NAC-A/B domain-containing protein n=1 Tax=Mesocestoides corti TaxID=53468 RepID=A0A5K3F5Z2_MESCO
MSAFPFVDIDGFLSATRVMSWRNINFVFFHLKLLTLFQSITK